MFGKISLAAAALALVCGAGAACAAPGPITLPGDRLFPEGVAVGPDGSLYVGGATGGIVRVAAGGGTATTWLKPGDGGTRSIFGIVADARHSMLWACSNDLSALGVGGTGGEEGSWLKGFDLNSGKAKVSVRLPGMRALCNDVAVAPDGAVYVTNGLEPTIFRLSPGGDALDEWLTDPRFQPGHGGGLDGIAFGGDGNLYVTSFVSGELFRIAVAGGRSGTVTRLATSRPLALAGVLRPIDASSFALIEGPGRLDRVTISGDEARIDPLRESLNGPTGVDVGNGTAWFVEGQISYLLNATKRDQSPVLPFRITPVALGR